MINSFIFLTSSKIFTELSLTFYHYQLHSTTIKISHLAFLIFWQIQSMNNHLGLTSVLALFSTILLAILALRCRQKVLTAAQTVEIFSASSLGISNPKYSSMATTSSTESKESNPSYQKVAWRVSLDWLHLAAVFNTWNTLPSTSSNNPTWVESDDEVNENRLMQKGVWLNLVMFLASKFAERVNIFRSITKYFLV